MSRNDIRAGGAYLELTVKRSKFNQALTDAQKRLQRFGSSMVSVGLGVTAMGGAIVGALAKSVTMASDFEESFSKFQTVFGDNSDAVKAWSDDFAAEVGRSKKQVVDFMAGTQDLLVPMGFDDASATEFSKTLTTLATDLASFNNKSDKDVMADLHSAMVGSTETMAKYGVIVNETAVKQELLNQAIDPKTATNAQKAQARLTLIMEGTTSAQGDAIRTSGSFSNQLKRLQAIATDAATGIGSALLPAVASVTKTVGDAVSPVVGWIEANQDIVKTIAKVALGVTAAGAAIVGIGGAVVGLGAGLGVVLFAVKSFVAGIALAGSIMGAVSATIGILLSPVGLLAIGLTAAAAAWLAFTEGGQKARQSISGGIGGMFKTITDAAKEAGKVLGSVWDAVAAGDLALAGEIAMTALKLVMFKGIDAISNYIGDVFGDTAAKFLTQIMGGDFSGAWNTVVLGMQNVWASFTGGIVKAFSAAGKLVIENWKSTVNELTSYILQEASKNGAFGKFFERVSGVDVGAEMARSAEIDQKMRDRGMNPGQSIADQIRNGTYEDPATAATANSMNQFFDTMAEDAARNAENAARAAVNNSNGATAAASAEVTRLSQELADLQRRAAMVRAAGQNGPGGAGFGVGSGAGAGGAGGGLGAAKAVGGFSVASVVAQLNGTGSTPQVRAINALKDEFKKEGERRAVDAAMQIDALRHPPGAFV